MGMATGEEVPSAITSALSRFYLINIKRGEVVGDYTPEGMATNDKLTQMQQMATLGLNRKMMREYIRWLIPQIPALIRGLNERFTRYRKEAMQMGKLDSRIAAQAAHIMLGYDMFWLFITHITKGDESLDDMETATRDRADAWEAILENCRDADKSRTETEPYRRYIDTLASMLLTGDLVTKTVEPGMSDNQPKGMVGYKNGTVYYIMPEKAYEAVNVSLERSGQGGIGANKKALREKLAAMGLMEVKKTNKGGIPNTWYWLFDKRTLWGDDPATEKAEQMAMDTGYTVVDEPLPFK